MKDKYNDWFVKTFANPSDFLKAMTPKCSKCGAELPRYSNYEYDCTDPRGYSEVLICAKCKTHHRNIRR